MVVGGDKGGWCDGQWLSAVKVVVGVVVSGESGGLCGGR